jgi:alkyl hydroperoxide reductase subunit AhpF
VFEDLTYEELKRRANAQLPDKLVAVLEACGERRIVAVRETLYRVDDRQYPFVYLVSASMSQYLIELLRHAPNVKIEVCSQVVDLCGDERLGAVKICDGDGRVVERSVGGLFVMIGAEPCTGWLNGAVRLDDRGFILTGHDCGETTPEPYNLLQTSLPGIFAGDVRSGSVKRVASAVGEGSAVVQAVHARLAALRQAEAREPVTV